MNYSKYSIAELQGLALGGDAEAQFALGVSFAHGKGVPQDYARAVHWLKKAAQLGHAGAEDSLGVRYATGQGVAVDEAEAVRWFQRAARRGYSVAQFNLGLAFVHGSGVAQDYEQAYAWFALSASQGDAIAEESRELVAASLDWDGLKQAKIFFHKLHKQIYATKHDNRTVNPVVAGCA